MCLPLRKLFRIFLFWVNNDTELTNDPASAFNSETDLISWVHDGPFMVSFCWWRRNSADLNEIEFVKFSKSISEGEVSRGVANRIGTRLRIYFLNKSLKNPRLNIRVLNISTLKNHLQSFSHWTNKHRELQSQRFVSNLNRDISFSAHRRQWLFCFKWNARTLYIYNRREKRAIHFVMRYGMTLWFLQTIKKADR